MPVIVQTVSSKVTALWGRTYIRGADGKFKLLQLGDDVARGDVLLTEQNAIAELSLGPVTEAPPVTSKAKAAAPDTQDMDRAIADLERGDADAATAAGLAASDGVLTEASWVQRIKEEVTPLSSSTAGLPSGPIVGDPAGAPRIMTATVGEPYSAKMGGSPGVKAAGINDAVETEGGALVFTVTLDATTNTAAVLPFDMSHTSSSEGDVGAPLFSNGVVINADGTLTVPAGVSSFVVTVPIVDDATVEGDERLTVTVGTSTATGTLLDNDSVRITQIEPLTPGADGGTSDTVIEGGSLVFGVQLSAAASAPKTFPFALGNGTTGPEELGAPVFSNGVTLNADGTITVPAGVDSFTVTVPTVQDTAVEPTESAPLSIGGVSVTGYVQDDDAPVIDRIEPKVPGPDGATSDTVTEGGELVFAVQLSAPTNSPTNFPFTLGGGSAAADELGSPVFSNGVTLNADGTITVPAGVDSFTVTVPTVQDTAVETTESAPLSIGGVSVIGYVRDDDAPIIDRIEPKVPGPDGGTGDTVTEGGELVFAVQLSAPTNAPTNFPFTLGGGSAAADELGSPVFSNGVTLNADGTITVPAGVDSFSVTVPTVQDTAVESTESAPLTIGGVSVTGFVADDDVPVIDRIEPKIPNPDGGTSDTVTEGGELVFAVQLSAPTNAPTKFPFTLGGGSAAADELGSPVFSNGVTLNDDGTITIPAGVDSFTVTVPTVQDTAVESTESAPLTIGGVSVTGYVQDDDAPVIDRIEPKVPGPDGGTTDTVTEGGDLVFAVQLSAPTNAPTSFPFTLGGGSAAADELGSPVFSNGVTLNADGTITVPAGVDSFTVTVPTVQDTAVESTESAPLTIGGVSVTGFVQDDDAPVIDRIEPKVPGPDGGTSDTVTEGGDLVFAVQLSAPTNAPTNFPFTLGGGSAAADELGSPVFSNGVTLNADGTITVPAGVDGFTVTVPTVQDTAVEPTESAPLTIGGVSVTGYVQDDDAPVIDRIEPKVPGPDGGTTDTVTEGGDLVFAVQLSAPTNAPTNFPFTLGGGSAAADELGSPVFSNGVTLNADGTITVPAGVDSFTVTVPTVQDTVVESTESAPLTIGGVSVTGFVADDDVPVIDRIEPKVPNPNGGTSDTVTEGGDLVFAVQLSAPTNALTKFPFTLGGGSAAADELGAPVFSNGVTLNDDGTITVPAGVESFTVTVPTLQDTAVETTESAPLSIGGVSVTGYVQDDDAPVIDRIEPKVPGPDSGTSDTVTEGGDLVFAVQLSAPTNAPTKFPFTLGGGSAEADELGSPVFSNGVTLNDDGTITVPAGVESFTVTVPTLQDTAVETTESAPLSIGGVSVTGFVQDDDAPVIDRIEPKVPGPDGGTSDTVTEGGDLVFAVQLSAPTNAPTNFPFTLGGGSAEADELGSPVFSNGVTLNADGTITVPAGVDSFTVTVPTVQDTDVESTESAPLTIGGVSVTGYVADDDVPVIDRIEPKVPNPNGSTSDTVTEGGDLVFAVQLSAPTNAPTSFPFTLGGGSAAADELGSPVFSNGVTLNADGTITVPAGVDSFTVTVPTVQDTAVESTESAPLTIGGVSVTGYVADDDVPVIDRIEPKVPGADGSTSDTVTEGGDLVFAVQLSAPTNAPTKFPFTLGGGSAAADELGSPVFSNGVTLNADGSITVPAGVDSFTVTVPTVQDTAVEPTESAPLTIGGVSVTGYIADDDRNSAPKVTSTGASVSEESLAGGIKDDPGQPLDLRDRSTTTGRVVITDAEGDAVTDVVLVAPATPLTSAGQAVVWTGTGTSVLTASAGGATVATAQIDANGNYSFTLLKPIEHADGQGENVQQLDIGVQASDGKAIGSGTISITVEDDTPAAADLISVINAPMVNTNVMVVLDVSGSMGDPSGIPGQTRLQAAVSSLQTVLDRYDDMGDVAVRLVTFSSEGKALGDSWTTVAEAKTLLANLQSCGSTNYDDALADAIKAFDAPGRIPDGQNVAYFLSDGEPTVGSGNASTLAGALNNGTATTTTTTATTTTGGCNFFSGGLHSLFNGGFCGTTCNTTKTTTEIDKGIQPAEEKIWTDFLSANGIDARAVGMGTTQATLEQLNPIAYDGVTQTNTGATAVAHFADLTAALAPSAGAVASGNLFSAGLGADGGHVHSFTVEGIAYTYNPDANGGRGDVAASAPGGSYRFDANTQSLTVDTASGGRFTVDMDDGTYQYRAPGNASAGTNQNFGYALIDNDGDISQATGIIKLERDTDGGPPTVKAIEPGLPGPGGDSVTEGTSLVYTVDLSSPSNQQTSYSFSLGGGSAGAGDVGAPVFSDGVKLNADGSITVPTGVSRFTVTVPTTQDNAVEGSETVPVRIGGITATGTITDDDVNAAPVAVADQNSVTVSHAGAGSGAGSPLYFVGSDLTFGTVNPDTGTRVTLGRTTQVFFDVAVTPDGAVYGITGTGALYAINPATCACTFKANTPGMNALAADESGTLYGTTYTGQLFAINPGPGSVAPVGNFGCGSAGDVVAANGKVYMTSVDGRLLAMDLATHSVTVAVANLPADLHSLSMRADGDLCAITASGHVYTLDPVAHTAHATGVTVAGTSLYGIASGAAAATAADQVSGDVTPGTAGQDRDPDGDSFQVTGVVAGTAASAAGHVGQQISGTYGTLTLQADGSYTYTVDSSKPATQALGTGTSANDVFSYSITDARGGTATTTLTLNVNGGDSPVQLSGQVSGTEDQCITLKWEHFGSGPALSSGQSVSFTKLPADGELELCVNGCWRDVSTGEQISKASIDCGQLRFKPDANEAGADALGRDGVGNGKNTYAVMDYAVHLSNGQMAAHGSLDVDIKPVADCPPTLTCNLMSAHGAAIGAPAGHHDGETLLSNGTVVAAGTPGGYFGLWHHVCLQSCSVSPDKDGSEQAFYQLKVNQLDVATSPTVVALNDGTVLAPAADGSYWLAADQADKVWLFRQWGAGPSGNQYSHQSVTATSWNAELDANGTIIHKVQGNSITSCSNTPLVLDLDGNGIQTVDSKAGASFDYDGDGVREATGWVGGKDGLLVRDADGDGHITAGRELFGDAVQLADGSRAVDGYAALRELDSNKDGVISAADRDFAQLKVWVDGNGDGSTQDGELLSLKDAGVASLNLQAQATDHVDNGNHIALTSDFTRTDGSVHAMADVWFGAQTPHEPAQDATSDIVPLPVNAWDQQVFAWELATPASEPQETLQITELSTDAGLDLRDLLGGATLTGAADPLAQLLEATAPLPAQKEAGSEGKAETAAHAPSSSTEEAQPALDVFQLNSNGAENFVMQELMDRNKLDHGF